MLKPRQNVKLHRAFVKTLVLLCRLFTLEMLKLNDGIMDIALPYGMLRNDLLCEKTLARRSGERFVFSPGTCLAGGRLQLADVIPLAGWGV